MIILIFEIWFWNYQFCAPIPYHRLRELVADDAYRRFVDYRSVYPASLVTLSHVLATM